MKTLLRFPAMKAKVGGLSRSTIYLFIKRGEFPRPVALGARAVGWREDDLDAWIASRPAPSGVPVAKKKGSAEVAGR